MKYRKGSLLFLVLVILAGIFVSCQNEKHDEKTSDEIYDLLLERRKSHLPLSEYADSVYDAKTVNEVGRDYIKGYFLLYDSLKLDSAAVMFNKVLEANTNNRQDRFFQMTAASDLALVYDYQGRTESMMIVAIDAFKKFPVEKIATNQMALEGYLRMYASVGYGMILQGNIDEADTYFQKSYALGEDMMGCVKDSAKWVLLRIESIDIVLRSMLSSMQNEKMLQWIEKEEKLMAQYETMPGALLYNLDILRGNMLVCKAQALLRTGHKKEAAEAYEAYLQTEQAHTPIGRFNRVDYLAIANRNAEAAGIYESLDELLGNYHMEMTLDVIQSFYLTKFHVNDACGRRDSAYAVAKQICLALDSSIVHFKRDKSAEVAAIYHTQQKDQMIVEQHAELMQQRVVGLLIAIVLLIIFFTVYILLRRQSQRRLAAANQQLEESNRQLQTMNLELQEANDRAEESSRMKTNFIKQISHEIRTPLNILGGFTQVVTTSGMELDEATRLDINHQILDNTNRITGLVNKMLELSDVNSHTVIERSDETTAERIALQAVGDSGVGNTQQVVFNMQIDEDVKEKLLRTNENQAVRALSLLLDNASKYTKEGSILLKVTLKGNHDVAFMVEDTGIGVPASEAEHIFEEFVQLDDYCEGTGIGLTVARSIVQRLGGNIVLDTTYHDGARFVMTLPE